jgi:hypothetical protein
MATPGPACLALAVSSRRATSNCSRATTTATCSTPGTDIRPWLPAALARKHRVTLPGGEDDVCATAAGPRTSSTQADHHVSRERLIVARPLPLGVWMRSSAPTPTRRPPRPSSTSAAQECSFSTDSGAKWKPTAGTHPTRERPRHRSCSRFCLNAEAAGSREGPLVQGCAGRRISCHESPRSRHVESVKRLDQKRDHARADRAHPRAAGDPGLQRPGRGQRRAEHRRQGHRRRTRLRSPRADGLGDHGGAGVHRGQRITAGRWWPTRATGTSNKWSES